VFIGGESGTGKELVARTLHAKSPRRGKPFVAVSCSAFPDALLEAELFGHERGAFAGAVKRREGRFKAADGGTLFLDEIAEVPLPAQAKILRALQEGTVDPLGTNQPVPIDVRIISASNQNLRQLIHEGKFREDLFYRLNVLDVSIPPLRARKGDLPLLLQYFLRRLTPPGKVPPGISPRAWAALSEYDYPGNVREFAHAIERGLVLAHGSELDLEHLPPDIVGPMGAQDNASSPSAFRTLPVALKEFERQYLARALALAEGKRGAAAELLGISRKSLWEKLRQHGLSGADGDDDDVLATGVAHR
jgi:DNA-binding NtrC family response regulator